MARPTPVFMSQPRALELGTKFKHFMEVLFSLWCQSLSMDTVSHVSTCEIRQEI